MLSFIRISKSEIDKWLKWHWKDIMMPLLAEEKKIKMFIQNPSTHNSKLIYEQACEYELILKKIWNENQNRKEKLRQRSC